MHTQQDSEFKSYKARRIGDATSIIHKTYSHSANYTHLNTHIVENNTLHEIVETFEEGVFVRERTHGVWI